MLPLERRTKILEVLYKQKKITTNELEELLGVSACTIRNDLRKLEEDGLVERSHGGAVIPQSIQQNFSFSKRQLINKHEKDIICRKALDFIRNGNCIIIDASSTCLTLAKHLHDFERLMVVTNGIYTALELKDNPNINLILTGGIVRPKSGSLEGLLAKNLINQINADVIFVSAQGFTLEEGLTDFNLHECELKKLMISKAKKVVALLDYLKIDRNSSASFARSNQVDVIITDAKAPQSCIEKYRQAGIEVVICE
ncbi:DeoR/GlpR family DNA-binding transcription regulator [Propionispora hippei]|uniref:Transcriptional regulator, DeoR family n=1 Tax=Propionispora hippei DSM 15287 TaxID=1123003 RepID=A0A1M6J8J5_9FIRM|nr:DeoR/GlpR family DNA-binding transcription regulator [Propionispora hippei]SHJ43019.1 transcriptional regulator, DeoR family [Propionispora hippei DSM 15287]